MTSLAIAAGGSYKYELNRNIIKIDYGKEWLSWRGTECVCIHHRLISKEMGINVNNRDAGRMAECFWRDQFYSYKILLV